MSTARNTRAPALTPWFPIAVKPVRVGVYGVSCDDRDQSGLWYSYWDGSSFGWYSLKPAKAFHAKDIESGAGPTTKSWRGLAEEPKS